MGVTHARCALSLSQPFNEYGSKGNIIHKRQRRENIKNKNGLNWKFHQITEFMYITIYLALINKQIGIYAVIYAHM